MRMPSQYAVNHPMFPVNQRSFHVIVIQVDSNTQALWYTIHFDLAKFHGRVADQHKSISLTNKQNEGSNPARQH